MQPSALTAAGFTSYPPQARAVAQAHLDVLKQLPLAFLPSLLHELIEYDFKFPVERAELDRQLTYLSALTSAARTSLFAGFQQIQLDPALTGMDWCGRPGDFTEQLSAYLWQTHQMTAFRDAATAYGNHLQAALLPPPLPVNRLGIAVIGLGAVPHADTTLFNKLREHGTYFNNIDPDGGPIRKARSSTRTWPRTTSGSTSSVLRARRSLPFWSGLKARSRHWRSDRRFPGESNPAPG